MYISIALALFICSKCGAEYVERFEKALEYVMGKNSYYGNEVLMPHLTKMWVHGRTVALPTSKKHTSTVLDVYMDGYAYDRRDLSAVLGQACPALALANDWTRRREEEQCLATALGNVYKRRMRLY